MQTQKQVSRPHLYRPRMMLVAYTALNLSLAAVAHAEAAEPRTGEDGNWMTGGRDYQQSYYSPLTLIDAKTVAQLGFAWNQDIDSGLQGTPIVVNGVMFASGAKGAVYSFDARTGAFKWSFKPQIPQDHIALTANRGVAVWRGKVYVGAGNGYLFALDAATGAVVWQSDTIVDRERTYYSTGAPYIAGNVVIIGNGGAEFDARGYVTAYDLDTGQQKWRFFIVPGDPKKGFEHPELEMAAKTWDPNSPWNLGGGGTAYDGMAYDPRLNLLYVGTGNGVPWNRDVRSPAGGDNLFLSSILAIRPETGRLVWHYQVTPGDRWDYTATQKLILADLKIHGKTRQVIMQAPKNGFFYVLDRKTGELLSAKPFAYVNWASHVDLKTGRPVVMPSADYSKAPTMIFPSPQGAHNWYPMAYNPGTGLVYIPTLEAGRVFGPLDQPFVYKRRQWNTGLRFLEGEVTDAKLPKDWPSIETLRAGGPNPLGRTYLRAWDPIKQTLAWEIETTHGEWSNNPSGVMTTASGLVFQGHVDGSFRVFDGKTGRKLHGIEVGNKMRAAPMTYRVDGEQYVAIVTGESSVPVSENSRYAQSGRVIAFKLGGGEVPDRASPNEQRVFARPPLAEHGTSEEIARGEGVLQAHCAACHAGGSRAPDLTQMTEQDYRELTDIVLKGSRLSKGMPSFEGVLSLEDVQAVRAAVISQAWRRYREIQTSTHVEPQSKTTAGCPAPKTSGNPINLLIVTGGHAYDPGEFFAFFSNMPNVRYQHVYMNKGKPIAVPPGGVGQYDVVLFYDLEPKVLTPEWRDLFSRGRGIAFLHHALGSFPDSAEYEAMIGGRYTFPSDRRPLAQASTAHNNEYQHFTITDRSHPITCALDDFDLLDEAYDNFDVDPGSHVLITSNFPKRNRAAAWIPNYADKRVVYIQPGHGSLGLPLDHGPSSYQSESFMKLVERAISWAAGRF